MNRLVVSLVISAAMLPAVPLAQSSDVVVPIATDSRIKTFVYNENDVFSLLMHYGYQANIEFGAKEMIETVSVGDRIAFQVIPAGRRLFIRPMEESARTNMTVITNERAYQFDLKSTGSVKHSKEELVYVAKFFYPDEVEAGAQQVHAHQPPPLSSVTVGHGADVAYGEPAPYQSAPQQSGYNFLYSVTGPEELAPVKMYDDGRATYISLPAARGGAPGLFEVTDQGAEIPLPYRSEAGMLVVDKVLARITVRYNEGYVCIYNDTLVPMEISSK